ncbi:MAG: amidohydrolase family protein [Pseudomonadota bacterium]
MSQFTCIEGAQLLTLDAQGRVLDPGELWIEGARIVHVGLPGGFRPPEGASVRRIDGRGRVVMPGFANCHTHSYAGLLKGTVDTIPLDVFMVNAIIGAGARRPREVYVSAMVGCLEMLLTGTTACVDHFSHRPRHDGEALDAVCQAYHDAGVRAAVAPMFSDLPFAETVPMLDEEMPAALRALLPSTPQPHDPYFAMLEAGLERWRDHPTVRLMLGIDGPQRCSHALLERAGDFARQHDLGNHTHLLEAKTQWAMAEARDQRGFVAYLNDLGLAGPRSSFAHFVWFTDADLETAAASGVAVVHNPASNLIIGSGIQPLLRLVEAGVPVAFGSDGLNAGNMSMFEKTRLAALLHRVTDTDSRRWLEAGPLLRMATVNGAKVLGHDGELGELSAGHLADLVVLDGNSLALSPRGHLTTQLVFYEHGASVRHVFVHGEQVVADGKPTRFDADALLGEAREIAARLAAESHDGLERALALHPGLRAMTTRVLNDGCGPCRFAGLA